MRGLSVVESATLLRGVAGHDVAETVATVLHRETGGNPLFLGVLLRHLIETDSLAGVGGSGALDFDALDLPDGVRDVVVRRSARLSSPAGDALRVAAVVGTDFDASLLGAVVDRDTGEILELMDEAASAGLVAPDPSVMGRYTFSHALIRQALYSDLEASRRTQLHARIAAELEELGSPPVSPAMLAQHFAQGMPLVGLDKVIEYTNRAGEDAVADLAFEDAVEWFSRALDLLPQPKT